MVVLPVQMKWKLETGRALESSVCCMGGKMPSASAKAWVLPACQIVPSRPQPHCFLLPVALELWVYIQKMHRQQER